MNATEITNAGGEAIGLPYPFRGILGAGKSIIVQQAKSDVDTWLQDLLTVTGGLKTSSLPTTFTGPFDTVFGPAAGTPGVSPTHCVDVATTGALPAHTYDPVAKVIAITATGVLTVDGVAVALGTRIFVKDEGNAQVGIYSCTQAGAVGVQALLTRAWDWFQSSDVQPNMQVAVNGGSQAGAVYGVKFTAPFSLDSSVPAPAAAASFTSAANEAALAALSVTGMADGTEVYVQTYRTNFKLLTSTLFTPTPHSVIASSAAGKVWVRDLGPNAWTYQFSWFYNAATGSDENDGATAATPIKTLDEFCRRVRAFSGGINGTQEQYAIQLQTDVTATDTWNPSGVVQSDGVGFSAASLQIQILGFQRALAVPGGSGALTAASALATLATNAKATLIDANGNFSTLKGYLAYVADTATVASSSGATATIASVAGGLATLTGLTGMTSSSVGQVVTISGAATPANNGTFPVVQFLSATSVVVSNPNAVAPDANNGAITWTWKDPKIAWIINAPAFVNGTGGAVTAVSAGIATLSGWAANTFDATCVGKRIRISGGIAANNGDFTITTFNSPTSVNVANASATVDATVLSYQGIVEMGPTWYQDSTMLAAVAAPSTGSPYCVVRQAFFPQAAQGFGLPAVSVLSFTDCELQSSKGVGRGATVSLLRCRIPSTGNGAPWLAGGGVAAIPGITEPAGAVGSIVSACAGYFCCWVCTTAPPTFGTLNIQENGYNRHQDCVYVDQNIDFREPGTLLFLNGCVLQGGCLACAAGDSQDGPRPSSALGVNFGGARALGVFNNVAGSNANPNSVSSGFAIALGRNSRAIDAATNNGRIWGVGVLGGLDVREKSSMLIGGTAAAPTITDTPGQAGFPVQQIRIDGNIPIPTTSATTGVPTAAATTSGTNPTFVNANGIATVTVTGATFTAASVGRTLTIAGANTPANNGTYPIESFVGATQVTIRNPAAVTDAVGAGTGTENPVVTQWAQLYAAPYSGNANSYLTGASITRIAEL